MVWKSQIGMIIWGCIVAIVTLALFFEQRASLRKAAGTQDDKEQKWGFGQILALETWAPVLVQFVYTVFGEFVDFRFCLVCF